MRWVAALLPRQSSPISSSSPCPLARLPTPSGKQSELAPEEKLLLLKQVISTLIANSEDVGRDFVREVRRIHYLESPQRAIRGEASREEFEELQDEGIDVLMLPSGLKNEFH